MRLQSLLERVHRLWTTAPDPTGLDGAIPALPLRDLLRLREPGGGIDRAIHKAQIEAVVRLVPGALLCQFLASALLVVAGADCVPQSWLLTWFAVMTLLCLSRGTRAIRLLVSHNYAKRRPPSVPVIMTVVGIL